jgi:hypothetical protein
VSTTTDTITLGEAVSDRLALEALKAWAKRTFTKALIADLALGASVLGVWGVVLFALHKAMEGYTILAGR